MPIDTQKKTNIYNLINYKVTLRKRFKSSLLKRLFLKIVSNTIEFKNNN